MTINGIVVARFAPVNWRPPPTGNPGSATENGALSCNYSFHLNIRTYLLLCKHNFVEIERLFPHVAAQMQMQSKFSLKVKVNVKATQFTHSGTHSTLL